VTGVQTCALPICYVPSALATPDSEIFIRIRNKDVKAKVVKMPFLKIKVQFQIIQLKNILMVNYMM
jgi:glycine cleavage system aminomethyltransferase T